MQLTVTNHLKEIAKDDAIKLVVLTGTGEYYTSGADFLNSSSVSKSQEAMQGIAGKGLHIFK